MPCTRLDIGRTHLRGLDDNSLFRLLDQTKLALGVGTLVQREIAATDHQRVQAELSRRAPVASRAVKC